MIEASYSHVGNNFALTFHEEDSPRRAAVVRDLDQRLVPFLPGSRVRAADRQHRRHRQLLPARRASAATTRSSSASSDRNDIAYTESQWGGNAYRALPQRRGERGPALPPLRHRVRPAQPQLLRAGQLHAREDDGQSRHPVRLPDRLRRARTRPLRARSSARRPTRASTTASPTRARRSTSCRRSSSPARTPACPSRTGLRASGVTYDLIGRRPQRRQVQLLALRQPARLPAASRACTTPSCRRWSGTRGWTSTPTASSRPTRSCSRPRRSAGPAATTTTTRPPRRRPARWTRT